MKTMGKWIMWLLALLASALYLIVWGICIVVGVFVVVLMVVTLWQQIMKLDWLRAVFIPIAVVSAGAVFMFWLGPAATARIRRLPWRKE